MRTLAALALPLALLVAAIAPTHAQDAAPDLATITRRLDDLYRSSGTVARIELTVVTPRQTRTMRMRSWARGTDRALVVIEAPARDEGTATLRVDRNLWNYMPRISRTIRVPPSMMLSSWMGSDLTNDDLTQSTSYRTDFTGSIVGRSESPRGWLVRYDAREGVVGLWRRIEFVVAEGTLLPIEARHFDRRMQLARVMRFEDVRELDGRRIPTRMILEPRDREGHRTEMRYLDIDFDAAVPESTFSLTQLEQRR
ncbi:outer membrane lipoprotein-sorting protein [Sandaracinus amylolyticus]|uniref:Outer membrane lipoprotein-sorting protein n=1 Tax=Sandaracinus amylolyticus TaxID=927083 RepID=A0A0F6SHS1_9BACT|nr:outer membrane lipoprotein-sorting protein [Sandaracinus amylolyticus]AKF10934.1 Outer membrane lipoprotein-sorting protein [Sandaracinus amylolyticus]